jgi:hypothetical protein
MVEAVRRGLSLRRFWAEVETLRQKAAAANPP